jgi:hypothetical protein
MLIKFENEKPKVRGLYIWRAPSGNFYLAEIRITSAGGYEEGEFWVLGCSPGPMKLTDTFGGTWSERLEMEK